MMFVPWYAGKAMDRSMETALDRRRRDMDRFFERLDQLQAARDESYRLRAPTVATLARQAQARRPPQPLAARPMLRGSRPSCAPRGAGR